MNWTEGTLNRYSRDRKGKETILRQKQHFAKARSGHLNANVQKSPPSFSFLPRPSLPSLIRRASLKPTTSSYKKRDDVLESSRHFPQVSMRSPNPASSQRQPSREGMLRQKTRRLLLKGDWVGTDVQRPIVMRLLKSQRSPNHAWGARLSRHESSRNKLRQLLGVKPNHGRSQTFPDGIGSSTPNSLRKVRIRVGSRERTLGGSSNVSRSHRTTFSSSQDDCGSGLTSHRETGNIHNNASCLGSNTRTPQSSTDTGQADQVPTSPLLFHPVPTRPALVHLLSSHSYDSDDAESTVAQVGVQRSYIPPSQVDENEAWRAFINDSDETQHPTNLPTLDEEGTVERMVSPGVSQRGDVETLRDTDQNEAPAPITTSEDTAIHGSMEDRPPEQTLAHHLPSDQPEIMGSEHPTFDDLVAPTSGDFSLERPDDCFVHASEGIQAGRTKTQEGSHIASESSDAVSLLVVPSSPNISPSTSNKSSHNGLLQLLQPEEAKHEPITSIVPSTEHQNQKDPSHAQNKPHTVEEHTQSAPEDENDIWRKFVLDSPDQNLEQAFENARKETAKNLRPSITPREDDLEADNRSFAEVHRISASPLSGPDFEGNRHGLFEDYEPFPNSLSTTASASHIATAGESSPVLTSESSDLETTTQTDQAAAGSSSSKSLEQDDMTGGPKLPMVMGAFLTEPDKFPPVSQPHELERHDEADEGFRFARPKLFLGKKLGSVDENRQIALSAAQIRGRSQKRRRATRANDGRANIRKLPNYGSDPIEEFEDDSQSDRAQQGSIFGSLETERTL